MLNIFQRIVAYSAISGISLLSLTISVSAETVAPEETSEMSQVTSVSQLSDVRPTDWAFQALQSLVERYGCIAGYPDKTYRGNRALTRYEFAAGLNACLDRVNELIAAATADLVKKEDLATLQKLQEQFAAELATLRGRVDSLEARTSTLEKQQFSTTTKLRGQVIASVNAGGFSGDRIIGPTGQTLATRNPNPTMLYRVSIGLDTSFNGTDLLRTQLDAGSGTLDRNIPDGRLDNAAGVLEPNFGSIPAYSYQPNTINGTIAIGRLFYQFKPTKDMTVAIGPDIRVIDFVDRNSYANLSFLDFSSQAFVNNLVMFPVDGPSAGAAIDWKPGNGPFSLRAVYNVASAADTGRNGPLVGTAFFTDVLYPGRAGNPARGGDRGLFGQTHQGTVEVEYAPSRNFALRVQYAGGQVFGNQFNAIGANVEYTFARGVGVFGRYGRGNYDGTDFGDNVTPNYWMFGLAARDLFKRGAIAGVAVGQPFITDAIGNATQTNFEAFYNYPVNRNVQITPALQVITNASNQDSNGTIVIGTLRTVFSF
jgi:porin